MNKCLLAFCFFLYSFTLFAAGYSDKELKQSAYSLENYAMCQALANDLQDDVMALYYEEMLHDGLIESEKYTESERYFINSERTKAMHILNNINRASMSKLCQSRFDITSRQYYEQKLKKAERAK